MLGLGWAELILRESPPFVRARDNVIELRVQTPDTTCVRAPLAGVYFIPAAQTQCHVQQVMWVNWAVGRPSDSPCQRDPAVPGVFDPSAQTRRLNRRVAYISTRCPVGVFYVTIGKQYRRVADGIYMNPMDCLMWT